MARGVGARLRVWTLLCLVDFTLSAAPAANGIRCASCHPEEARFQSKTPMGVGMQLPPDQAILKAHPRMTMGWRGFTYTVERKGDRSIYSVSDGSNSLDLPIEYAFGVHTQTYVLQYQGRFLESMVSYYSTIGSLAPTMGPDVGTPRNLVEALGREQSMADVVKCFGCHSSGAVADGRLQLEAIRPGLDCEHCHTGATEHMESFAKGKAGVVPERLGQKAAEDMANFCGGCHRTWETVVRTRSFGETDVRFQPYRLSLSKCFLGNDRRANCTACHNPHVDLVRDDPKRYDSKCLACHGSSSPTRTQTETAGKNNSAAPSRGLMEKACPVAEEGCTSCHMPKVELPGGHALFCDHYIRVVRQGEPYPY